MCCVFFLLFIKAMASGTPVITGHVPALTEVAGGAVEHVDALDAGALGDARVALAHDRERREHLSSLGLARASTFSWERAAPEPLDVYRLAANREAGRPAP